MASTCAQRMVVIWGHIPINTDPAHTRTHSRTYTHLNPMHARVHATAGIRRLHIYNTSTYRLAINTFFFYTCIHIHTYIHTYIQIYIMHTHILYARTNTYTRNIHSHTCTPDTEGAHLVAWRLLILFTMTEECFCK